MLVDLEILRNELGGLLLRALSAEAERNKLMKELEEIRPMLDELTKEKDSPPKSD